MKCYSVVLNKSMCVSMHLWQSWSKERSYVEVKSFKRTWGKFVVIRRNDERHLFNIKPNVMLTYTSNRESAYSLEGNVYCYQTHTRTLQAAIHYIRNHTQWSAPSWNTRTHTNTHIPRAGLIGYSSCCFPDQTMAALLQAWQTRLCQGRERGRWKKKRENEGKQTER